MSMSTYGIACIHSIRVSFEKHARGRFSAWAVLFNQLYAVFLCDYTGTGCEADYFTTDAYNHMGSLTCRAQNWIHAVYTVCSGTNKSAQELTRRDRKIVPYPAPPGDRTQGLRIEPALGRLINLGRSNFETEQDASIYDLFK